MSLSDRLSLRAVDGNNNDLVSAPQTVTSGADDGSPQVSHKGRTSQRQLARLQVSISDRDRAVLQSLAELHYMTTRQLERLHYSDGRTPLAAARGARRAIGRLHRLGLVSRLDRRIGGVRAGSAAYIFGLGDLGGRLLGLSARRRSREPSLIHLNHVLDVAELVVQLHEAVRRVEAELLAVEGEPRSWRQFVGPHGGSVLLKPDLRLTIGRDTRELHWFVEVDRGSEHRPALTRKLDTYVAAWREGSEQARFAVFPRVLWIVPDVTRASVIGNLIAALTKAPAGMFSVTTGNSAVDVLLGTEDPS